MAAPEYASEHSCADVEDDGETLEVTVPDTQVPEGVGVTNRPTEADGVCDCDGDCDGEGDSAGDLDGDGNGDSDSVDDSNADGTTEDDAENDTAHDKSWILRMRLFPESAAKRRLGVTNARPWTM